MVGATTDEGRQMLVCGKCGWRIRVADKKQAEGHVSGLVPGVSKCAGSVEAKEARSLSLSRRRRRSPGAAGGAHAGAEQPRPRRAKRRRAEEKVKSTGLTRHSQVDPQQFDWKFL
jgi:hypothetical protein